MIDKIFYIEGLHEELPVEVYMNEEEAVGRFNDLYAMYNKALGHVLPTMYKEVVVTKEEYWNPKTEEWTDYE